jgi:hypothetical protein
VPVDADDDRRWGKAYAGVLAWLAITIAALTLLSQAHW